MKAKNKNHTKTGFTIIEIVLVLAIAGLIFLMVFVALPALQRSQRNQQRKNTVGAVATAVTNYIANNNKMPFTFGLDSSGSLTPKRADINFIPNYIDSTCKYKETTTGIYKDAYLSYTDCSETFVDPNGIIYTLGVKNGNNESILYPEDINYRIMLSAGNKCGENGAIIKTDTARAFIVYMVLEGGAVYCVDNS